MIGNILRLVKEMLPKLNEEIKLDLIDSIVKDIDEDLKMIKIIDSHFLDGDDGYVDYYSQYAELQLQNQKKFLDKYLHIIIVIQATLLCIDFYKKTEKSLSSNHALPASKKESRLELLERDISSLIQAANLNVLLENTNVKSLFGRIQQNDTDRNELKIVFASISRTTGKKKSILITRSIELQTKIMEFELNVRDITGFAIVEKRKVDLQKRLNLQAGITTCIPHGMLDVKRVLYILQNRKLIEKKIKKKHEQIELPGIDVIVLEKVKAELVELEKEYVEFQFSRLVVEDEKIVSMLLDVRNLMAASIRDYQAIVVYGGEYNSLLHKTTAFYWDNLSLYRQTFTAVHMLILKSTALTDKGKFIARCIQEAYKHIPVEDFINVALEHVDMVDVCLGEREKAYGKIIAGEMPIHFYKDISSIFNARTAAGDKKPFFYIPYNSDLYVLDHPTHTDFANTLGNCFGESLMFLQRINGENPSITNICPERDLINFQLDQSRKIFGCKKISKIDVIEKSRERGSLLWEDIKAILIKAPESKEGDLCLCRFGGGRIAGYEEEVKHVLGLIKLNSDDCPYKYVVYDYSFGMVGCSSDEQLKIYFNLLLEYYTKFYNFRLDKHADVSLSCKRFITSIRPIEEPNPLVLCERQFWSHQRLVLLAKYGNTGSLRGVKLALGKFKEMSSSHEKTEIYNALLENEALDVDMDAILRADDESDSTRARFFHKPERNYLTPSIVTTFKMG